MLIKTTNRKAYFEYNISDEIEAGIILTGNEVKSIRSNKFDISNAYIIFHDNEAFLIGMHIDEYFFAKNQEKNILFNPKRERKLLLNRSQINKFYGKSQISSYTIIPLKVYIKKGFVKILIALAEGKNKKDKREYLKEKAQKKEIKMGLY
jgi:SsrA-binding protein